MLDTSCILGQEFQWVKGVRKWRGSQGVKSGIEANSVEKYSNGLAFGDVRRSRPIETKINKYKCCA